MKRRTFIQSIAAGAVTLAGFKPSTNPLAETTSDLEKAFLQPPAEAHARTWWHWMNGNVTAEGITLDLEAMKRVGIRGFQIFQVGTGIVKGPVDYSSPEHTRLLQHAARAADRLGLEFDIMNCPGWSSSGGPWITPEHSMKQITWSETVVEGGKPVSAALPRPFAKLDFYRDAYVLAFSALQGEAEPWRNSLAKIFASTPPSPTSDASGMEKPESFELRPPASGQPAYIQMEFSQPYQARSLCYTAAYLSNGTRSPKPNWLESSADGKQFQKVCDIDNGSYGQEGTAFPNTASFPAVRAKFFRIVSESAQRVGDIHLSGAARIPHWPHKANFARMEGVTTQTADAPKDSIIDPAKVIDVTAHMDSGGRLAWDAPAGTWTVLRIGYTTTAHQNHPAPDGGEGLECDKYSRAAYDFHFDHFFGEFLKALGPLGERGLAGALIDSYETGMQNWTQDFALEFQKRRGYDLLRYLPAMTGRVVGSLEISERFLWDIRRTCADLMADNYYGRFVERCHENKLKAYAEPYSGGPFEEIQCGARLDVPMGEFWVGQGETSGAYSVKLAGSIGHVYGQRVVGAESFTGSRRFAKWENYPYQMKNQGDLMYTHGLNEFIFHRNAMQPHPTARPGMTMGPWGWECDRTNTIYEELTGWLQYVARAQNLLRQGTLVADLVYFTGVEVPVETPVFPHQLTPTPPQGYYYDVCDEQAILTRMTAQNGRIALPDGPSPAEEMQGRQAIETLRPAGGMSYRVLVLPEDARLTLEMLRHVRDMVKEGVTVVGPKPLVTPGLAGYPNCDAELRQIAEEVWGDLDGEKSTERTYGKGRVFWGLPLTTVFEKLGVAPDCDITSRSGDAPINFLHRRVGDADVYFVANRRRRAEDLVVTFRVKGMQPELWNPETGAMTQLNVFEATQAGVRVPLHLDPAGSVFVVFRSPARAEHFTAVLSGGKTLASTVPFPAFEAGRQRDVTNDFTMAAWAKPDLIVQLQPQGDHSQEVPMRSLVISPAEGNTVYGTYHISAGLAVGRNGVAVMEREHDGWHTKLRVEMPISGWTHFAVVYKGGAPSLYVNGKLVGRAEAAAGYFVHPGIGDVSEREGAEYFDGDMSDPELFTEPLSEERIQKLAAGGIPAPVGPPDFEWVQNGESSEFLGWNNLKYTLKRANGSELEVMGGGDSVKLSGPWTVTFPPNLGAPKEVILPELASLHLHPDPGVRYFSGTATYRHRFLAPKSPGRDFPGFYLDLGWVYVFARVKINGRDLGLFWKPPFLIDITTAVRAGQNDLEVAVTNQWVNRLIGDEQLPPENEYLPSGAIKALPQWYLEGQPKPPGGRVTFATWKHFDKDSPLLASGLAGPVVLRSAVRRKI